MEVLENLGPGQKLSFKGGKVEIVDNPSRIGRWLSGENKHTTLQGVTDIVHGAMASGTHISSKVICALDNLKNTYHKSKTMVTKISELQKEVKEYMYERLSRPIQ
jgi:hypothetical protein